MSMKLPGIRLTDELKRFYPHAHVASHVLGFTNIDGTGLEGVERGFEAKLQGKASFRKCVSRWARSKVAR